MTKTPVPTGPVPNFWPKVIAMCIGCTIVLGGLYMILLWPAMKALVTVIEESDLSNHGGQETIAYAFFEAMSDGDVTDAYNIHTTESFRAATTVEDLQAFIDENPIFSTYTSIDLGELHEETEYSWMSGFISDDDEWYTLYVELQPEGNDIWHVNYFEYDFEYQQDPNDTTYNSAYEAE